MIDTAHFRVPWNVPFTAEFEDMRKQAEKPTPAGAGLGIWRRSQYYERTGMFEVMGLDVVFHERCSMTKLPNHKIEILKTGEKSLAEIWDISRRMFHCDPDDLGIMRADLTADIPEVPVPWFRDHTLVSHKRTTRIIGEIPNTRFMTVASGVAETLYAGKSPNQFRIYDKTGERMFQLKRENHKIAALNKKSLLDSRPGESVVLPMMTFEQMFGYDPKKVITRVEVAIHGKSLEKIGLVRAADLRKTPWMHPFEKIKFINDKKLDCDPSLYSNDEWCAGLYWQSVARQHGIAAAKREMYRMHGNKHFYEKWKVFVPFMQTSEKRCSYEHLQSEFSSSCHRQLYAA